MTIASQSALKLSRSERSTSNNGARCLALMLALAAMPALTQAASIQAQGVVSINTGASDSVGQTVEPATGTDTVTQTASASATATWGGSGSAMVQGTASFGALSGFGSASSTGTTANSVFQAQPVADANDTVTIHSSAPVNLTLSYEFKASTTVPNSQPGTVTTSLRGTVALFGNLQFIGGDNIFWAGDVTAPTGGGINVVPAGDASNGSAEFVTGSSTIQVDPGQTYNLDSSLRLFGEAQNLNGDGHTIDIAAADSLVYWITFDNPDAYITSESGATYAPPGGGSSVPDSASTLALLGGGLGALGFLARRFRPGECAAI